MIHVELVYDEEKELLEDWTYSSSATKEQLLKMWAEFIKAAFREEEGS